MLFPIALVVGVAAVLVLWLAHQRPPDTQVPARVRHTAMAAGWTFGAAVSAGLATWSVPALGALVGEPDGYPLPLVGALLMLLAYIHARVLFLDVGRWAYLWASRAPERHDRTWRMEAAAIGWGAVGFAGMGAIVFSAIPLGGTAFAFLLVPLAACLVPLYETWLSPWLQFWRARKLRDTPHAELDAWLAGLADDKRLPRFRVRVHEGQEKNAYATGGMFDHLVLVGGGLATGMTTSQLKAVLAHEVAHVIRRDIRKLLVAIVVGGACHATVLVHFVNPNLDHSTSMGFLLGMAYAGFAAPLAYIVLPGLVGRRLEYGADRLAAELLGGPEQMIDALDRLCELRAEPRDKKSLAHPTTDDRIDALRQLPPSQAPA